MEMQSAIGSRRNESASIFGILMDANTAAADQIEGAFDKVVSRIALVVVHHASNIGHAVVVERSARRAKLLVDFNIHFSIFVVAALRNHLEGFVKAVRQESRAINVLLEIGSDGGSGLRRDDNAISEAATTKQVKFLVIVVEGHRGRGGRLEGVERRGAADSEGGAALSDEGAGGAGDRTNAHNHVLALHQLSGMVKHERESSMDEK